MAKSKAEAKARARKPLVVERRGAVLTIGVDRSHKRNAIDDATIDALERIFSDMPDGVRAAVLHGVGPNFSAGLDLNGVGDRDAAAAIIIRAPGTAASRRSSSARCRSSPCSKAR